MEACKAAALEGKDPVLQKQVQRGMQEVDFYKHQLAQLHNERDRALVEMTRLEEVAPLAQNEHGVNKRIVSAPPFSHLGFPTNHIVQLESDQAGLGVIICLAFVEQSKCTWQRVTWESLRVC